MSRALHRLCGLSSLDKPVGSVTAVLTLLVVCCSPLAAHTVRLPARWKTGADFQRALDARLDDAVWSAGTAVRQALTTIAQTQGVAIMLDRRIDPGSAIELSLHGATVREIIEQLAAQCHAVPTYLDDVVYVGPREGTRNLASVATERREETQRTARAVAARLTARRPWHWDELAEPRALLAELADEARVKLEGVERVPHDLWAAWDLPGLAWSDRMTLLLAGFGLTYELADGGASARLVPMPAPTLVKRDYPATLPSSEHVALKALFPEAVIDERGTRVELSGTAEEHTRLQQWLRREAGTDRMPKPRAANNTRFTLSVTGQPVRAILDTLENQLNLTFQFASNVDEPLHTRVSFDVREVPLSELLDAALTPAGLTHRQQGDTIVIESK